VQKEKDRRGGFEEEDSEEYKSNVMKHATNFMGNFGKSFKGSLWGEKSEKGDRSARGESDKNNKNR
jgi:hypothetical protein